GDGLPERFKIVGDNFRFPPQQALALGIAFHELATNAVKYGALSNSTGSILIEWKVDPDPQGGRIILHWQEKDGPPVMPTSHKGFASRVIVEGLAQARDGPLALDCQPAGLLLTVRFLLHLGSRDSDLTTWPSCSGQ